MRSLRGKIRRRLPTRRRSTASLRAEPLEPRAMLATFTVTNLLNAGPGSLRTAITQANALPGADDIAFSVAGTIRLTSTLPAITDTLSIAGSTAPGFVGSPRVTVNFGARAGLRFATGSDGSTLANLALVRASGAGVTLEASKITLTGNHIGVLADGRTAGPNTGAGVLVAAGSSGNQIGLETSVSYSVTSSVPASGGGTLPVMGWQGLTTAGTPGQYLITGTTENTLTEETEGLLYVGPITAQGGTGYAMVMPDQPSQTTDGTTAYSADNLGGGQMRIVGTYSNTGAANELGFIFTGTVADVANPASYAAMPFPTLSATWNIPHSTSGGLVVGNYDSSTSGGLPAGGGRAYVYDAVNDEYLVPSMVYPGSASNTAYGIWHNGGTSYTICGGWSESPVNNLLDPNQPMPLSKALLVDFDSATKQFSNWKSFVYTPPSGGGAGITHFEGISGVEPGKYTLAAVSLVNGATVAGFVTVYRNANGSFGEMQWTDLTPPVAGGTAFADSVYGNAVVGIDPSNSGINAYQATVTPGGNLISGNGGNGVTVAGSNNVIAANTIGLTVAGNAALPNRGDGVRLLPGAQGNLVGRADPVTSIDYFNTTEITADTSLPVESWTGIRGLESGDYLITGSTESGGVTSGLLYVGPLDGDGGAAYAINYPGGAGTATSVYGPDDLGGGNVLLVGTYVLAGDETRYGFAFRGNLATMAADAANPANYETIWNGSEFNYLHSTMGGLAVGNYIASSSSTEAGRAYIYDFDTEQFTDIVFPGTLSNTAYGIWDNGDGSYTIAGGFSELPVNNADDRLRPIGMASLVDYDRASGTFSNWRSYSYQSPDQATAGTHFMGISSVEKGVYTLSGTGFVSGTIESSGLATVVRQTDGSFGDMTWVELAPPESVTGVSGLPSANSVYGNAVVGIVIGEDMNVASYQAEVNVGFQLSNVISGNRGNGITIAGANDNQVAMNFIGTSFSGTAAVPNQANGILITERARGNMIGGRATGGNDPTDGVFVRPPQGNLISGNRETGVMIICNSTANTLSGNFVGTTASGNAALGNGADGVAIVNASGNALLGTTFPQDPFVFYNVLSGNGGNGLRITNSNDTIVQANFTGVGADNATVVANGGSGILVNGTSARTLVGGPIPLGNVNSGNNRYGIEVAGTASGFVAFNSFVGMVAFGGAAPNGLDGIRITSTGGNNLIRTCLVAGNLGNGIVIAGRATGVTVEDTSVGTDSKISTAIPNQGSGIVITDDAHGNTIGGFQVSVQTKVHLSGNLRYGLEITGNARNNRIINSVIGGGFEASNPIPNALGGIYVGPRTIGTIIGGTNPLEANRVLTNGGAGITISGSYGTQVLGNEIRSNLGTGIVLTAARAATIGAEGAGNTIVDNVGYGLFATGNCARTRVVRNTITGNTLGHVDISSATGITYVP